MPERPERLFTLLKSVNDDMHEVARSTWREFGLPAQVAVILRQVDKSPGVTVSDLSRNTGLAKSNISTTVDSLVDIGFIEKHSDPRDHRLARLYATNKAKAHFHKAWGELLSRLSPVTSSLSDEQLDSIIDALETLKAALDQGIKDE